MSRQKRASLAVLALVAVSCVYVVWSMSATAPPPSAPATRGLEEESRTRDAERREIEAEAAEHVTEEAVLDMKHRKDFTWNIFITPQAFVDTPDMRQRRALQSWLKLKVWRVLIDIDLFLTDYSPCSPSR